MSAYDPYSCGLLIIGAEILSGAVVDQNTTFLLQQLFARGLSTKEVRMVVDQIDAIAEAVAILHRQYAYVLTTGGIGPTHDDVTFSAIAKGLNRGLSSHPTLQAWFSKRSKQPIGEAEQKMTLLPIGSHVLLDEQAHAMAIGCENIWILPGVPSYMRQSFALLAPKLPQTTIFERSIWLTCGEVPIAKILHDGQIHFPEVQIGSYPQTEERGPATKVTLHSRDQHNIEQCYQWLLQALPPSYLGAESK